MRTVERLKKSRHLIDILTVRIIGKQNIYIIDEDGNALKYGIDDISIEVDSKVSELVIYDNHVEIDLEY